MFVKEANNQIHVSFILIMAILKTFYKKNIINVFVTNRTYNIYLADFSFELVGKENNELQM